MKEHDNEYNGIERRECDKCGKEFDHIWFQSKDGTPYVAGRCPYCVRDIFTLF